MARVLVLLTLLTNGRAAAEPTAAAEAMSAFRRGAAAVGRDDAPRRHSFPLVFQATALF